MEQKLATYKLDPIKNDENAPNLPLRTRKTHLIAIDNEEHARNPPSRTRATHLISHHEEGRAPNPSILHEFLFQPRPASHIMSENSTLRGHPGITPIYHPSLPMQDRITGGGLARLDTQSWAATRRIKQRATGHPQAPFATGTKDESDTSIGIFTDDMCLVRTNRLPSNPGRGPVNAQYRRLLISRILYHSDQPGWTYYQGIRPPDFRSSVSDSSVIRGTVARLDSISSFSFSVQ